MARVEKETRAVQRGFREVAENFQRISREVLKNAARMNDEKSRQHEMQTRNDHRFKNESIIKYCLLSWYAFQN